MMRFDKVSAGFGGRAVIRDVNLNLERGMLTGLIGPNGSGKTTLIRTAAGQLRPMSGQVTIAVEQREISLDRISPRDRAKSVSYMPQTRTVPDMTVRRLAWHGRYPFLSFGRVMGEKDKALAQKAMETAGVLPWADRPVNELSGGERQRAYLAMMLAQDTEYMVLDEPTTYLDIRHQLELMELMKNLSRQGKCVMAAIHDLALALSCCDKVAVMDGGSLLMADTPDAVYASGVLEEVFRVNVRRTEPAGYVFEKRKDSGQ